MEEFKIKPSMGAATNKGVEHKVNLLTKRLLAEGYSAENYPDYVKIPSGCWDRENALFNIYGGFEYKLKFKEARVYETPCGLLLLGKSAQGALSWMGTEWSHENDCPVARCPKDCTACNVRPEPFASLSFGSLTYWQCPVHPTTRAYEYEGSLEQLLKQREDRIEAAKRAFLATHKNACEHQMEYNERTDKWSLKYDPWRCQAFGGTKNGCRYCPCLQKDLGTAVGNIYYDVEIEGRDASKDGTFFEGARFHKIYKGYQYFDKPVNLVWAEAFLKVDRKLMLGTIRYNKMHRLIDSMTLYRAEKGEIDLHWEVKNIRIVKRNVRDIDQDLADIDAGLTITHVLDESKRFKADKSKKRKKAANKRLEKLRKDVLTKELSEYEADRAIRKLGEDEYYRLLDEKEQAPVQLSIFDVIGTAAGD